MASYRYTRNITPQDERPPEPPAPPKGRKKWENFWFYHKWHILAALGVALLAVFLLRDIGSRVEPDYVIGVITVDEAVPSGAFTPLGQALAPLADDRNGDGQTVVEVLEYDFTSEDPTMVMANSTRLVGDVQTGESSFYLVDDLAAAQARFGGMFANNDGEALDEEATDVSGAGVAWSACPVLTQLELGDVQTMMGASMGPLQQLLDGYTLVRRAPLEKADEDTQAYLEAGTALFEALTAGAGR